MASNSFQLDSTALKAIASLGGNDSDGDWLSAQRIIQIHNGIYFVWSHRDSTILTVNCTTKEIVSLVPTDTPIFQVEQLQVSPTGRWLALSGPNGLTVVELPKRSGRQGRFVGTGSDGREITCKAVPVAQRFFMGHPKIVVQKIAWHPGTFYDNYLVVLMSDNFLRLFNVSDMDSDNFKAEMTISLSPSGNETRRDDTSGKLFSDATMSLKASLGETAVDFVFAPPVPVSPVATFGDEASPESHLYPIFVLHGNGHVFCLLPGPGCDASRSRLMGPLPMFPDSDDNYGLDSCSILCLHPIITSPPILVIATNGGTIYHCVVLHQSEEDKAKEDDEVKSQASDWSSSVFGRNPEERSPDLSLYVYESVELELALTTSEADASPSKKSNTPFDYPILLLSDPSTPARYFCSHKAGIHCVGLPMVSQLSEMAQRDEVLLDVLADQTSFVEHLVCTQMSPNSLPAPILGICVAFPPPTLVFLMHDYKVQSLPLSAPYYIEPVPLLSNAGGGDASSPLRKSVHHSKEPFDKHIQKMLQRTTSQPIMKSAAGAQISNVECLKILARSIKVLREEYVARLESVRVEIERRANQLEARKRQQEASLARLNSEKAELRDGAARLSERYEDLKDNGERFSNRIQRVLQHIQSQQPSSSDAELRMHRQLKSLECKLMDMNRTLENIRSKEKYQFQQVWQARQNVIQTRMTNSPSERKMGEDQLTSIKSLLTQDGQDIADLVQQLKIAKNCLEI